MVFLGEALRATCVEDVDENAPQWSSNCCESAAFVADLRPGSSQMARSKGVMDLPYSDALLSSVVFQFEL